jgi:hypothetical protein
VQVDGPLEAELDLGSALAILEDLHLLTVLHPTVVDGGRFAVEMTINEAADLHCAWQLEYDHGRSHWQEEGTALGLDGEVVEGVVRPGRTAFLDGGEFLNDEVVLRDGLHILFSQEKVAFPVQLHLQTH